ncbi:uncharacterized protein CLUP02_05163 [Colletotrichum lupini]|uniref:Uncharacterized protein n=1 Tax=Colletotrichum lupini TaxID=145971 RepID=A0A9Q8SM82_9PEZI|nr:uncharacterized protein CLUP02_05163 [Colletotrichum lupini]UQC79683.1 hypothetical protein CLUP02_05163 [Colletotrichum lupini]
MEEKKQKLVGALKGPAELQLVLYHTETIGRQLFASAGWRIPASTYRRVNIHPNNAATLDCQRGGRVSMFRPCFGDSYVFLNHSRRFTLSPYTIFATFNNERPDDLARRNSHASRIIAAFAKLMLITGT